MSCLGNNGVPSLSSSQLRFCQDHKAIMRAIADGAANAIRHCKHQFSKDR